MLLIPFISALFFVGDYFDLDRNFSIKVKDGYQIATKNNASPFLYIGKELIKGSYPNLNIVQSNAAPDDLHDNSDPIVNELAKQLPNYKLVKKEPLAFHESKKGVKLYGEFDLNGVKLRNIQYYFLMNGYLYIVTGTTRAEQFNTDKLFFDETTMSIKKIQ